MSAGQSILPLLLQQLARQQQQQPMSEQPPGSAMPNGMQMPQLPQPMQQQPQMSPSMEQQQRMMQNQAQIFGQQPNLTSGSMGGLMQSPMPVRAGDVGKTEWDTKGGRNAATLQASIESFTNAFQAGERKNWQHQAAQAEQLWQSYSALNQALSETQDPKAKQAIQQQIDAMMQDKNTAKILKKAHQDPTSAYGVGIQRAMQQSKQQAQDQAKLEQMYAEIQKNQAAAQAEQARAQQEQATAALRQRQTQLEGQVTPAIQAQLQSKQQIEQAKIDQETQRWKQWADVENRRTDEMLKAAQLRSKALDKSKGSDQLIRYFKTQYDGLAKQYTENQKQILDVQNNIEKTSFWRRGHLGTLNQQLVPLRQKSALLQQQMQDMNQRLSMVTTAGAIQMPAAEPQQQPVSPPPATSQTSNGDGSSPDKAITIQ